MIESMVFGERAGFSTGPKLDAWLGHTRYKKVFFLDPLTDYEQTAVRIESQQAALEFSAEVKDRYRHHGYEPIAVPSAPVAQRVQFILSRITPNDTTEQAT